MKKLAVSKLKTSDIMTKKVVTVTIDLSLRDIMKLLTQHQISGAPVVESQTNILLSLVSEADLLRFAAMSSLSTPLIGFLDRLPDRKKLMSVSPEDPFVEIYKKFLTTPFRRIPVVDKDGMINGIVSRRDILNAFLNHETDDSFQKSMKPAP